MFYFLLFELYMHPGIRYITEVGLKLEFKPPGLSINEPPPPLYSNISPSLVSKFGMYMYTSTMGGHQPIRSYCMHTVPWGYVYRRFATLNINGPKKHLFVFTSPGAYRNLASSSLCLVPVGFQSSSWAYIQENAVLSISATRSSASQCEEEKKPRRIPS